MDQFFRLHDCELNILYFGNGNLFKKLKSSLYKDFLLKEPEIPRNEFLAKKIITDLWQMMKEELGSKEYEKSDVFKIMPGYVQQHIKNSHNDSKFEEQKFHYLSDYLSGMTDRYAIFLWEQLFNPKNLNYA